MNIEALAKSLESWMRVDTWHTTHSSDQKRFHKALFNAIKEHGCQITENDFKEAIISF
jgi:cell wall assembly regulator SMI1